MGRGIEKLSLHKFDSFENLTFDSKEYSKLKFGNKLVADRYGKELAQLFFDNYLHILLSEEVVIAESAYNYVKNAASLITDSFYDELNKLIIELNCSKITRVKINRTIPYTTDYGTLNKEQRTKLLEKDEFTLDYDFVNNKFIVFIDDVYISGTHHSKIEETVKKYKIPFNKCLCLYYGEYLGDNGYDIESKLNFAYIKDSSQIDETMLPIVRVLKMTLGLAHEDFLDFISKRSKSYLYIYFSLSLGEGYYKNPNYQNNLNFLKNKLNDLF